MSVLLPFNRVTSEAIVRHSLFTCAEALGIPVPTSGNKQGKCRECVVEVAKGMACFSKSGSAKQLLKGYFCLSNFEAAHISALNCGTGMDMTGAAMLAQWYRKACSLPIMVQPNAGLPVLENFKAIYKQLPTDTARAVPEVLGARAAVIGSCCGRTPDYPRVIRRMGGSAPRHEMKHPDFPFFTRVGRIIPHPPRLNFGALGITRPTR